MTNFIEAYSNNQDAIQFVNASSFGFPYQTIKCKEVLDIAGTPIAQYSIVPTIYIQDVINKMRTKGSLSLLERYERLIKAGRIYKEGTLCGLSPEAYVNLVSAATGLSSKITWDSLENISYSLENMKEILASSTPKGALWNYNEPTVKDGRSYFSRRGNILSVITAGNGPGVHGLWPQAIAMGYRTLIRPSSREPFTAQRLVCALEQAGLSDYVALVPTDYRGSNALIEESDLSIVYGGDEVAKKYSNDSRVLVQGPGRSKIIVGKDICEKTAVELAAESILSLGGAACVSTSAILVEGDVTSFTDSLRRELAKKSNHNKLPRGSKKDIKAYQEILACDEPHWKNSDMELNENILCPHVSLIKNASDSKLKRELAFPSVVIAPFNPSEDYKYLSDSLVVTILSRQQNMIERVLSDSSIANVYVGEIPTTWMNFHVPHDGYLTDFLMCNRGLRIQPGWV